MPFLSVGEKACLCDTLAISTGSNPTEREKETNQTEESSVSKLCTASSPSTNSKMASYSTSGMSAGVHGSITDITDSEASNESDDEKDTSVRNSQSLIASTDMECATSIKRGASREESPPPLPKRMLCEDPALSPRPTGLSGGKDFSHQLTEKDTKELGEQLSYAKVVSRNQQQEGRDSSQGEVFDRSGQADSGDKGSFDLDGDQRSGVSVSHKIIDMFIKCNYSMG